MVVWCRTMVVRGGVVALLFVEGVRNTEPKYGRKPPRFLLRIEEVFHRICFPYFLLTCHDVTTKYGAKYGGKYGEKIS